MSSSKRAKHQRPWYCCGCRHGPTVFLQDYCPSCGIRRCTNCPVGRREKDKSDRSGSEKRRQKEGRKAPDISKPGGAGEALQPPLGTRSHLDKGGEALPPPHQMHMQPMHRAASDRSDNTGKPQQSCTGSYNEACTFTTYAHQATWDISETPNEALSITQHEEHATGPSYGASGTDTFTPSDLSTSHAGSPPLHGIAHEALPYSWIPQPTSDHDIPLLRVVSGDGLSGLEDAGQWTPADAGYANDLSNMTWLDPQLIFLLGNTDNPTGVDDQYSEPQGDAALTHDFQIARSSPSSSVPSSLDQDSPNSTVFSHESSGMGGFPCNPSRLTTDVVLNATSNFLAPDFDVSYGPGCKHTGNEYRIPTACSHEQPRPRHPADEGNYYPSYNYPKIASMDSKSAPSHLNNPRNSSDNQATWSADNSQSYTRSMGVDQRQPGRKRKRSSNTSNAIMSGNSPSTQGDAPTPAMDPQEADPNPGMALPAETLLACHFYKMNPKQHSSCAARTFQCIGSLCQHIRQVHRPKGCHDCDGCFQPFTSETDLHAHANSGTCRPTGGVKLPIVSRKHGTQGSKWYTVWGQLFPHLAPPRSPYRDENHEIDQFVQSFLRILQTSMPDMLPQDRQSIAVRLKREASRWRSEPGEPLDHASILAGPLAT